MSNIIFISVLLCLFGVHALSLPGPLVYVVTPSPKPLKIDEGRSAPFYYHNWMRRMDSPQNKTTTTTTPKVETPDLIFAEFESDNGNNMKSIRKLLERERIQPKTSPKPTTTKPTTIRPTTSRPIYIPDDDAHKVSQEVTYEQPIFDNNEEKKSASEMTDYFSIYNNVYNAPAPVYVQSTLKSTTTNQPTTASSTTSTTPPSVNVENIWHIIDNEKQNQYSGNWEEVPVDSENNNPNAEPKPDNDDEKTVTEKDADDSLTENFALPGFSTNPGNGAENESRAIRTEPNIRFPYVNLKPFLMKNLKNPSLFSNSKKGNNMYTSLDNFQDIKNPVRGEAQDVVPMRQPIDRYNPAQPYLPQNEYGSKSKQSSPSVSPGKSVANLVPPPPPPPVSGDDFPAPTNYESFPPYAPSGPISVPPSAPSPPVAPPAAPAPPPKPAVYSPPVDTSYSGPDSDDGDDGPPQDTGYAYKPPSPPVQQFVPTLPPLSKPFSGYSYNKPVDMSPPMDMGNKPDFQGYQYSKPEPAQPPMMDMGDDNADFQGYHYNKPEAPSLPDHAPIDSYKPPAYSYGHQDHPSYGPDYPELIFDKPHGSPKGADQMKGGDMGMPPPPPPADMKPDMDDHGPPMDDQGFPHDFPGDFKYHHDFDDHDYHHHHPHPPPTTTETPRVNRYSYYYLGKKLYYLPLYFSVYFIVYVGALIIKAVLRHKIVYPNSWRPNGTTASFFSKRSIESWDMSNEQMHELTGKVTHAIATAAEKYMNKNSKTE